MPARTIRKAKPLWFWTRVVLGATFSPHAAPQRSSSAIRTIRKLPLKRHHFFRSRVQLGSVSSSRLARHRTPTHKAWWQIWHHASRGTYF